MCCWDPEEELGRAEVGRVFQGVFLPDVKGAGEAEVDEDEAKGLVVVEVGWTAPGSGPDCVLDFVGEQGLAVLLVEELDVVSRVEEVCLVPFGRMGRGKGVAFVELKAFPLCFGQCLDPVELFLPFSNGGSIGVG